MKRIIISEGKHDNLFLVNLLTKNLKIPKEQILSFDQNTSDSLKMLKYRETYYFEKLRDKWRNYKILIKSENGKNNVIKVLQSRILDMFNFSYDPIFLIDLDYQKIDKFITKFTSILKEKFKGEIHAKNIRFSINEETDNSYITMKSIKLENSGRLFIIAFKKSLEYHIPQLDNYTSADIKEQGSLIDNFIKGNKAICEPFIKALNVEHEKL